MHPPPSCPGPLCMGRAPPRPARKAFVLHQFSLVPEYLPPRVGADLCVRPDTSLHGTRVRADTQVGPYGVDRNTHQPQKSGRGQSPAPIGRSRCQAAGRCGHRPLRKGGKAAATTLASGAQRSVFVSGHKGWDWGAAEVIPEVSSNLGQSLSRPAGDSSCCGVQNSLLADRSQNFDRSHSFTSLHLPPAALGSLPLYTREPLALRGRGKGRTCGPPLLIPPARAAPAVPGQSPGIPYR